MDLTGAVLLEKRGVRLQPQQASMLRNVALEVIGYRRDGSPIIRAQGASNLTSTYSELIQGVAVAGSALSDSSTGAVISTAAQAAEVPPGFWTTIPQAGSNRVVECTGWGIISTAASPATLYMTTAMDSVVGTEGIGLIAAAGTTIPTPAASLSTAIWTWNSWTFTQSISVQAPQLVTFATLGIGGGSSASPTSGLTYQFGSATPVALTAGLTTPYWVELYAKWGTAVSGCTLTCEAWAVQGLN